MSTITDATQQKMVNRLHRRGLQRCDARVNYWTRYRPGRRCLRWAFHELGNRHFCKQHYALQLKQVDLERLQLRNSRARRVTRVSEGGTGPHSPVR